MGSIYHKQMTPTRNVKGSPQAEGKLDKNSNLHKGIKSTENN